MADKENKNLTSTKRFGTRYGAKNKLKFDEIERKQRALHECPYCNYKKAKRKAVGIWECRKCDSTFTSKAYEVDQSMFENKTLIRKETEDEEGEGETEE